MSVNRKDKYWKANLKLLSILLLVWFLASYVCGILLVDWLNQFQFLGFKFGFWMAQQGSLYTFILLIFIYMKKMNAIDKKYHQSTDQK